MPSMMGWRVATVRVTCGLAALRASYLVPSFAEPSTATCDQKQGDQSNPAHCESPNQIIVAANWHADCGRTMTSGKLRGGRGTTASLGREMGELGVATTRPAQR